MAKIKCQHTYLFAGEITDWKNSKAKDEFEELYKVEEGNRAKIESYNKNKHFFQSERCRNPMASDILLMFKISKQKSGRQYECVNCGDVQKIFI